MAKFNQDIYMNQKSVDQLSKQIYDIHNAQNLIFLFRLFKLFSLTKEQFAQLNKAQRQKFWDFHEIRQQVYATTKKIRLQSRKFGPKNVKEEDEKQDENKIEKELDEAQSKAANQSSNDAPILNELFVIYKMRDELKEVIWTINNLHNGHIQNAFLYHIFINKQLNKLIEMGLDLDSEPDEYTFSSAYNSLDRTKVTAEQMCYLLLVISKNPRFEKLQNIFEEELDSILQVVSKQMVSYTFAKFITRIGLNHLEEVDKPGVRLESSKSNTFQKINDLQIMLDSQSISLYLYDLKQKKPGIDGLFFIKFNSKNILKRLSLPEIEELLKALIEEESQNSVVGQINSYIVNQIVQNSIQQAEHFKIYNDVLLNQIRFIIKYQQYADKGLLSKLLNQVSSEIINQTQNKNVLTTAFTNYVVEFIDICPPGMIDFYQLFEAFFFKQKIEGIAYQQLFLVYKQMANIGVDYAEYLTICHQVFFMNKHEIIEKQLHLELISLSQQLHDVETANIFGASLAPRTSRKLPEGIEFLSDFSESEGEEEKTEKPKEQ